MSLSQHRAETAFRNDGGLGKMIGNAVSLLTNDAVNRAAAFLLYALVARYLGALQFGQLSLALTLLYTFQRLAPAGLKILLTREVAHDRSKTEMYIANGSAVAVLSSILAFAILLILVRFMDYSPDTASAVLLVSLALLPYSLSQIYEAVFQAWQQMRYIAFANVPLSVLTVSAAFLVLSSHHSLNSVILLLLVSFVAILIIEWWLMFSQITKTRGQLNIAFTLQMTRSSVTFLGFQSIIAVTASVVYLILSRYAGEVELGLYNAASQLLVPVLLFSQSTVMSLFPTMCKKFDSSRAGLLQILEQLLELLMAIAIPATVGLFMLAKPVLLLLYGNRDFALAAGVLQVMVVTLIFKSASTVFGRALLACRREKTVLRIAIAETLICLVLGFVLITRMGMWGAAITTLMTGFIDVLLHYIAVSKLFPDMRPAREIWKSLLASCCMGLYLSLGTETTIGLLPTIFSAAVVYAAIWLILSIWSAGSPQEFKIKYLERWSF